MEISCDIEIEIPNVGPTERVKTLSRNNREIHFRIIKNCIVRTAARDVDHRTDLKMSQRPNLGTPGTGNHQTMRLVQLGRTALRRLIKLIKVTRTLVSRLGIGVSHRTEQLMRMMA